MVLESGEEARTLLSSHPTSASAARRFVHEVLAAWSWDRAEAEVALLCTDELVTNAILHVSSDIEVVVRRFELALRVEVHDRSPRPPLRRVHAVDADSGRGLDLVEMLSSRWGVAPVPGGKAVWFEVPVPPGAAPAPVSREGGRQRRGAG